ncbi:transporter [Plasmodium gonderi]|uniref:Transporter n=1 Tax=Plasmodium gonderi TaxID=77519 RepID=A0A1Y1J9E4_PLAGO|nr:transporter [Plasmodium gonderi]GAW79126.1 transporter [Plasmodium gonderi]
MNNSWGINFFSFLKRFWLKTDPNLPGAKQKTPFNISRLALLVICVIYTASSASIYFDWSAIRKLLLNVGKYKHLNIEDYADITLSPQYKRINSLYPLTLAIHFTTSVFCGFLYDHLGPKFTAMIGQICNIIAWIFFSIDSTTVDTTLIGFVFLGLGADTAFIPVLTISNLYPDASTFILTIVGAAASLSYAVPATLNLICEKYSNTPFSYICYGYILIILVPCLLTAIFLLPLKPFKGLDYYMNREKGKTLDQMEKSSREDCNNDMKNSKLQMSRMNHEGDIDSENVHAHVYVEMQRINNLKSDSKGKNGKKGNNSSTRGNTPDPNISDQGSKNKKSSFASSGNNNCYNKKNVINVQNNADVDSDQVTLASKELIEEDFVFHKNSITLFFKILVSYPSICVITYFILFNISTVFYGMVTDTYFSYDRSIINIINIMMPISCIPCIIFGRFINKYGAAIIIILMNAVSALMHLTALIKHRTAGLISAFLYMCVTSIYTSQIYCFIQNAFPSSVFGKLLGFASLCGGLFSLLCEKLYDNIISKDGTSIDPTNVVLLIVICFILMFLPLSILYFRKYERSIEGIKHDELVSQN